jgi:hypothetical protein
MMNRMVSMIVAGLLLVGPAGFASAEESAVSRQEMDETTERLDRLESLLGRKSGGRSLLDHIQISGAIEVEASHEKVNFGDPAESDERTDDLVLATVELGIDALLTDHVSGRVLFLYEDGEDVVVDEGYIFLDGGDSTPLYFKAGEMYLPFGCFDSNMISDPLTLELGETREATAQVGFECGGFHGAVFAFNGDIDRDGKDSRLDNFGASLSYAAQSDSLGIDAGVSWTNNITDSDGYSGFVDEEAEAAEALGVAFAFRDYVPGISTHAAVSFGQTTLTGEYVTLLEAPEWNITDVVPGSMAALGLTPVSRGEKIAAWNVELAHTLAVAGKETTFAFGVQGTRHAEEFLPEERYVGSVSFSPLENTALALECRHDEFETGDRADGVAVQLAIEF